MRVQNDAPDTKEAKVQKPLFFPWKTIIFETCLSKEREARSKWDHAHERTMSTLECWARSPYTDSLAQSLAALAPSLGRFTERKRPQTNRKFILGKYVDLHYLWNHKRKQAWKHNVLHSARSKVIKMATRKRPRRQIWRPPNTAKHCGFDTWRPSDTMFYEEFDVFRVLGSSKCIEIPRKT